MNDFFNTSLSGGVFISVICILRLLFKQHLPRTAFTALWLAATFRLLCPVQLPFAASFWRLAESRSTSFDTGTKLLSASVYQTTLQEPASDTWEFSQIVYMAVAAILLSSIAVLYVFSLREGRKGIRIKKGVYMCKGLVSPRVCGILRPRILLPYGISDELLPYILLHERIHILRLDNLWKLLALVAAAIHWFNPAAWVMVVLLGRDLEVSCDQWVLRRLNEDEKSSYALSLIAVAERCRGRSPLTCGFSQNPLEERIRCIMTNKKSIAAICAATVMILGTTAVFATDAPAGDKADSKEMKAKAEKLVDNVEKKEKRITFGFDGKDLKQYTAAEYEQMVTTEMNDLKKQLDEGSLSEKNYQKMVKELKDILEGIKSGKAAVFYSEDAKTGKQQEVFTIYCYDTDKGYTYVDYNKRKDEVRVEATYELDEINLEPSE